jgi:hypothetical protein
MGIHRWLARHKTILLHACLESVEHRAGVHAHACSLESERVPRDTHSDHRAHLAGWS